MTERSFQKELQDIVETKSPRARTFGAKFYKSAGNKKLFETNITRERKEIIPSFERKSSLESLAQNISEWPSPSYAHNLSFTHDGYIQHTATEMIIFMTDISVQRVNLIHFSMRRRKFDRLFRCFDPLSRHLRGALRDQCFPEPFS